MASSIKIDARKILGHAANGRVMAAAVKPVGGKPTGTVKPAPQSSRQ